MYMAENATQNGADREVPTRSRHTELNREDEGLTVSQEVDCGSSQTADLEDQMRNVRELEEQNRKTASRCHYSPHSSVSLDFGVHGCLFFRFFRVPRCGLSHQVRLGCSTDAQRVRMGGV